VELVLTALWEIVLQILGEVLIEFGFHSMGESSSSSFLSTRRMIVSASNEHA
jgi:hypothetical protein